MTDTELDELMESNIGLVRHVIKKFTHSHDDELYVVGLEGLWKACRTYDESKGFKFATYAGKCIFNQVGCYLRTKNANKRKPCRSIYEQAGPDTENIMIVDMLEAPKETSEERLCEIYSLCYDAVQKERLETNRLMLKTWIESNFEMKQYELGAMYGKEQAHVSKLLKRFRERLIKWI